MAVQDDEWKKFLESTEADDEEVETLEEDETEESEEVDDEKDTTKSKTKDDDESESDDDESEDEEDAEDDKSKVSSYKPRLKQFIKSDGTYDVETAEKSYVESGKQAVQLDKDLKETRQNYTDLLGAIKAKPEVAKQLFGEAGAKQLLENGSISANGSQDNNSDNPLLQHIDAQLKNQSRREYEEFVDSHPESVTDPEKARMIGEFLKEHGAIQRRLNNGEIPTMKSSLESAYRYFGWDLEIKNKEDVASAVKKAAATRTNGSVKRPATKKEISKGEEFFAKKLNVKL